MGLFSSSKPTSSPNPSSHMTSTTSSPNRSFSDTLMQDNVSMAEVIITKWDVSNYSSYTHVTSLFYGDDRVEATAYLRVVEDLQRAMQFYVAHPSAALQSHHLLVKAQTLMQTAMKRLQKEFYHILAANRDRLADSESISARSSTTTTVSSSQSDIEDGFGSDEEAQLREVDGVSSLAMSDLRSIAECMISSGYGKECVQIYKLVRKSIIDEGLYRMGFETISGNQLQKLDWEQLEHRVRIWLGAFRVAVRTLFAGERALVDHVFVVSAAIRESCFSEIARNSALNLLAFPESVAAKCKKSPERMFRFLDMYDAIVQLWSEIDMAFSYDSTSDVRAAAAAATEKLADAVRAILAEFESAIQKDPAKSPVPGGGLHPATRYVMNYISLLADCGTALVDILDDVPLPIPSSMLPDTLFSDNSVDSLTSDNPFSAVILRFAWIIFVLLCKLDAKAELYKDVGLSYLFLCNNLNYVVGKVRSSGNLRNLLGEEWVAKHEEKVRLYAANYERMVWSKVAAALPVEEATPAVVVEEAFRAFSRQFEETCRRQAGWVVPDGRLRDDIKVSAARAVVPAYREFYQWHRGAAPAAVRFAPEDLENHLSDLFHGETGSFSISGAGGSSGFSRGSHSR